MKIIKANYNGEDDTFTDYLQWKDLFDVGLLNELINEIIDYTKIQEQLSKQEFQELIYYIFHTYNYTVRQISYHHKTNDLFNIKNYKEEFDKIYIPRFQFVVECFISGDYERIVEYFDDYGKLID